MLWARSLGGHLGGGSLAGSRYAVVWGGTSGPGLSVLMSASVKASECCARGYVVPELSRLGLEPEFSIWSSLGLGHSPWTVGTGAGSMLSARGQRWKKPLLKGRGGSRPLVCHGPLSRNTRPMSWVLPCAVGQAVPHPGVVGSGLRRFGPRVGGWDGAAPSRLVQPGPRDRPANPLEGGSGRPDRRAQGLQRGDPPGRMPWLPAGNRVVVAGALLSILIGWGLGFPEPGQGRGQDGIGEPDGTLEVPVQAWALPLRPL